MQKNSNPKFSFLDLIHMKDNQEHHERRLMKTFCLLQKYKKNITRDDIDRLSARLTFRAISHYFES